MPNRFTTSDGPVYALRGLPEEVVAVAFAKYSRSRGSLRDTLADMLGDAWTADGADDGGLGEAAESARRFNEKWVLGFGHASVAEHAVVHLAVEGCSLLAAKAIEECRLASFTEKSTRYVKFGLDSYVTDERIAADPVCAELYAANCRRLLSVYANTLGAVEDAFMRGLKPEAKRQAHQHALDVARYLLPCSVPTNLGVTANARSIAHLVSRMLGNDLAEVRSLGGSMRDEATKIFPSLLRKVGGDVDTRAARATLSDRARSFAPPTFCPCANSITLAPTYHREATLNRAAVDAAALHWASDLPFKQCRDLAWHGDEGLADALLGQLETPSGDLLRCAEHTGATFELVVDQGAYRDIQRHRMATQTAQRLGTDCGFEIPQTIRDLGLLDEYRRALDGSYSAHATIAARLDADVAQYALPLAWRRRVLLTMNLREIAYFVQLRSGRFGHPSYRRIAQQMYELIRRVDPRLAAVLTPNLDNDWDWRAGWTA